MSKSVFWLGGRRAMTKEEGSFLNEFLVDGEEKLSWAHAVLVPLVFFTSALLVVGLLALVFDTVP
jgi:hypothetical protein